MTDIKETDRLWYYTNGYMLLPVIRSGRILPYNKGLMSGELPSVWLSLNSTWDPRAPWNPTGASLDLLMAESDRRGGGLARFDVTGIDVWDWDTHVKRAAIHPARAKEVEARASQSEADPEKWRFTYTSIPRREWNAVEVHTHGGWRSIADLTGGRS